MLRKSAVLVKNVRECLPCSASFLGMRPSWRHSREWGWLSGDGLVGVDEWGWLSGDGLVGVDEWGWLSGDG